MRRGVIVTTVLFLVLVHDLREGRVSLLFADETALISEERTQQQSVEAAYSDFRQAKEWFTTNNSK